MDCVFCTIPAERIIRSNALAYVIMNQNQTAPGSMLIIPHAHVASCLDLTQEQMLAVYDLAQATKHALLAEDPTIQGFNFGANDGEAAGQTVFHVHYHLIPRRPGDFGGGIGHMIHGR